MITPFLTPFFLLGYLGLTRWSRYRSPSCDALWLQVFEGQSRS